MMSAVKREAVELPELAYSYHGDITISDRSQSYGVAGAKSTTRR